MSEASLSQPSASLLGIPDELLLDIVALLPFHDHINLVRCCTKLREFLLQTPSLRKSRYGRILEPLVGEPYWWYSCTVDTHVLLHTLLGDPTTKIFVSLDERTLTRYLYGGYNAGKDQEVTTFKIVGNSLPIHSDGYLRLAVLGRTFSVAFY
ncbi:hypothetical protein H072_10311 [Dactylellina haptotyla CBS 200.50]|uniref:F-box domain-containing protein n=1 Tax=Dactylellina haptotyla (strain CBS 200.50) TaxID=1284197 RepID=S8BLR2_DACHA|nr:hypothetical protein H072_10311 [Dactylellina haptotyla CBS 200.50]